MSTALESNVRIQRENFIVTDEIEAIKKGRYIDTECGLKLEIKD